MPKLGQRRGENLKCAECGEEFYASPREVARRKHCSQKCLNAAAEKRSRTACVVCGTPFYNAPSVGGKYCKRSCYLADRQKRETCAVCGKKLEPHEITYCSQECMATGRRTLERKPCVICGEPMDVQPYQFETKKTCSRECQWELFRRSGQKGPGNKYIAGGYVVVYYPDHPDARKNGYVAEHRLVAEQKEGRRLSPKEHVHHLNGVKTDNRPENLEVINPGDHARLSTQQGKEQRQALKAEVVALRAQLKDAMARLRQEGVAG